VQVRALGERPEVEEAIPGTCDRCQMQHVPRFRWYEVIYINGREVHLGWAFCEKCYAAKALDNQPR
jgi:hypothetical protein